ncbi:MAG: class I SAM-dependent methyltransferase [Actinomycetes bacterium]
MSSDDPNAGLIGGVVTLSGQLGSLARWRAGVARLRPTVQRAAFAALYGPGARGYDRFTRWLILGEWERWQDAAVPFLPPAGPILELGSGTGALAARSSSAGRPWCCVESSGAMVAVARRRVAVRRFSLVRGDARAVPFAGETFAGAVATFPTSHLLTPAAREEMARVLAPDGVLVIVLSARLLPTGPRRVLRCGLLRLFYGGGAYARVRPPTIPGFDGEAQEVATPHGRALVWAGVKARPVASPCA